MKLTNFLAVLAIVIYFILGGFIFFLIAADYSKVKKKWKIFINKLKTYDQKISILAQNIVYILR